MFPHRILGVPQSGSDFNQAFGTRFSPGSLGPLLWLDAADASTITLNGTDVSAWANKGVMGGSFVQTVAAIQPLYETSPTGFNGLAAVYISKTSSDYLYFAPPTTAVSAGTVCIVARTVSSTGGLQVHFDMGAYTADGSLMLYSDAAASNLLINWKNVGESRQQYAYGSRIGATIFEYWDVDPGANGANPGRYLAVNGTAQSLSSVATGGSNGSTNTTQRWSLGAAGGGTSYFCDIRVGEVLVFPTQLSAGNRSDVTFYLKTKWGIP